MITLDLSRIAGSHQLDAELLEVVEERRVRGAVERTYRLRAPAPGVGAEEAATMSASTHA